ncbi:RNA polymerase sigma factor [Chryseolinea soli]|uniref:RNA polymerase sigma factor n=1 Tax=Chryseolinea soli TaxID=2321403 RepID=A0A385SYR9_9BACT|nr:sigma-70 family RNA polymerase sigma factor [Chryseolinea soli]AYB34910.1 sigma-70 family RNA polymerase sigma factor [Chryseolinea soli]
MAESTSTEQIIIERAIGGDPEAYRLLLNKYKTYAFSIAVKIVKNKEDAEEVVQDSFVKAFKALRNFNGSGKFSTWLYKIVYNTALTRIRNKKIIMDTLEEFPASNFDFAIPDNYTGSFEKLVQADQAALLRKALVVLTESENLVIGLYYSCENTIAEIEGITGWNPSTIKIRLFRARQKLYTELSKLLNDEMNELL